MTPIILGQSKAIHNLIISLLLERVMSSFYWKEDAESILQLMDVYEFLSNRRWNDLKTSHVNGMTTC